MVYPPLTQAQLTSPAYIPEAQGSRVCPPSSLSDDEPASSPEIAITELTFEGDLHLPTADQDQIAASIKEQRYSGDLDEAISEVPERVRLGWQNRGYFQVRVSDSPSVRVVTSSPARKQIAITVHVDEGQQYRLSGIAFKNNRAISNIKALRLLFPIADGDIFERNKISQGLEALRKVYGELGYINFTSLPDTRIDEASQTITLEIDVDEGKQFFLSTVSVLGLDRDALQKVLKSLLLKPGDVYNQRLLELFLTRYASLMPRDASPESRVLLKMDERTGTVALTFDFRTCSLR